MLCSEEDLCKVQGTDGMLTTDLHYAQRRPLGDPQSRAAQLKQKALDRTARPHTRTGRYTPPDKLLAFLESL